MLKTLIAATALLLAAMPASAEVIARTADSFTLRFERRTEAPPAVIATLMGRPYAWWDGAHSYSGDAANLSVDMQVGGCWCEKLPDGSAFHHGTVLAIEEDRLVFDAPFGPMHGKTTRADLVVAWSGPEGGRTLVWTLTVEGAGLGAFADPVDGVMGAAFARFNQYVDSGYSAD